MEEAIRQYVDKRAEEFRLQLEAELTARGYESSIELRIILSVTPRVKVTTVVVQVGKFPRYKWAPHEIVRVTDEPVPRELIEEAIRLPLTQSQRALLKAFLNNGNQPMTAAVEMQKSFGDHAHAGGYSIIETLKSALRKGGLPLTVAKVKGAQRYVTWAERQYKLFRVLPPKGHSA